MNNQNAPFRSSRVTIISLNLIQHLLFKHFNTNFSYLIQYVKSRPHIACGGSFYHRTTKEKIGRLNKVLVNSFFVYNKVGGWAKSHKRTKELKKY